MAALIQAVKPPGGVKRRGKSYYSVWQTVFEIDTRYVPHKPRGKGSYGVVCSALDKKNKKKVAIKRISDVFGDPSTAVRTLREMMIQRQIRHDRVLGLKDVMPPSEKTSFKDIYLVFELMDTDLSSIIRSPQPLPPDDIKSLIYQILSGLHHIHSANVLHRDLKPSNILVNRDYNLKICDFGLARTGAGCEAESMTEYVVARWYRAPELLLGATNYGASTDVWSAGCIFAELLCREPIFQGANALNQLTCITRALGTPSEAELEFIPSVKARQYMKLLRNSRETPLSSLVPNADDQAMDLLEKMLVFDPSKRITAAEALKHPYLKGLHDPRTDPPAQFQVKVEGIEDGMPEDQIRNLMYDEMIYHHPELAVGRRRRRRC